MAEDSPLQRAGSARSSPPSSDDDLLMVELTPEARDLAALIAKAKAVDRAVAKARVQAKAKRNAPGLIVRAPPPPEPPTRGAADSLIVNQIDANQVRILTTIAMDCKNEIAAMRRDIIALKADVKRLEKERQWWRNWHLKWVPFFRRWRDDEAEAMQEDD